MSDERQRQPHDHGGDGDALDRLLAQARWPEPSAESLRRLDAAWSQLAPSPRRTRKLWWTAVAAAAAVLLIAFATSFLLLRNDSQKIVNVPTDPETPTDRIAEAPVVIASRAPSLWEQAAMLNADSPAAAIDRIQPAIDQAIAALTNPPRADLYVIAASLLRSGDRPAIERHLLDDLDRRSGPERIAAIRILGATGTEASLPVLLAMSEEEEQRAAAASIAELVTPAQLAALIENEPDADRQRRLLGILATHPAPQSLSSYLAFVASPAMSETALAALDDLSDPPIDALFAHLDAPRSDRRLAAARALGRINGPVVSERLALMVERGVHRREALAALMSSGGAEASSALSSFRQIPSLVSVIRSVEIQLRNPF